MRALLAVALAGLVALVPAGLGGAAREGEAQAKRPKAPRGCPKGVGAARQTCPSLFVAPGGSDGRWTHLAGTYDGSTLRLFVDGLQVSSRAAAGAMAATGRPLRIGGNAVWGEWFRGLIDEVRVYDRALSGEEIREDLAVGVGSAPSRPGLVAAYSFDQPGPAVADGSGLGNVGVVSGAAWTSSGRFGGARSFDGVDDWVSVADADSLDLERGMTLEAWVRPAAFDDWRTVVIKEQPNQLAYALYANTGSPGEPDVPSVHAYLGDDLDTRGGEQAGLSSCRDRKSPCATFDRAYRAAQPGETVELAAGSYPAQTLRPDPQKTSGDDVVFVPGRRAEARVGGLDVHASHVTFERLTLDGDWTTFHETDDVTFRDLDVNGAVFVNSSSNIRVLGGSVGGIRDYKPQLASWPPGTAMRNILVEGVTFHDIVRTSDDVHIECLLIGGGQNVTIRNSRFRNCSVFDLSIGEFNDSGPPRNLTIENNFFGTSDGFYSLHFNTNTSALHDVVVRNNSSTQAFYHGNAIPRLENVRFVANVAPLGWPGCDPRIVYRANVWSGGTCGPTDLDAPSGFADPEALDLHLSPGAAAINRGDPADHPADDVDGERRPRGRAVDAGADERG